MMNTKIQVLRVVKDAINEEEVDQLGFDSVKTVKGCSTGYTRTAYSLILLSVAAFLRTSSLAPTRLPIFPRPEIEFSKLANQYA